MKKCTDLDGEVCGNKDFLRKIMNDSYLQRREKINIMWGGVVEKYSNNDDDNGWELYHVDNDDLHNYSGVVLPKYCDITIENNIHLSDYKSLGFLQVVLMQKAKTPSLIAENNQS